jgi:hypothetical protein
VRGEERTNVFRVVILRHLVGIRMGPLTRRSLSLARLIRSFETIRPTNMTPSQRAFTRSAFKLTEAAEGAKTIGRKGEQGGRTLLKRLDVPGGQGDPDLVELGSGSGTGLLEIVSLGSHVCGYKC